MLAVLTILAGMTRVRTRTGRRKQSSRAKTDANCQHDCDDNDFVTFSHDGSLPPVSPVYGLDATTFTYFRAPEFSTYAVSVTPTSRR